MITDKLNMINKYSEIPQIVKKFVTSISPDISPGRIILSNDIYVNVETYKTKSAIDAKFEAHEKYIDIQILLVGYENIYYTDKSCLSVNEPYSESKDIAFYSEKVNNFPKILLDGTNFVMLYPHEAHAPQVCVGDIKCEVKKIVIKIKI